MRPRYQERVLLDIILHGYVYVPNDASKALWNYITELVGNGLICPPGLPSTGPGESLMWVTRTGKRYDADKGTLYVPVFTLEE